MDKAERALQLQAEYEKGVKAKNFASNPIWKETVKELEDSYITAIRSGNWFNKIAREENCRRLQVLDDLVTIIENKIERGEQARKRLEANNEHK